MFGLTTKPECQSYNFCYNPSCELPLERIFKDSDKTLEHLAKCHKWILTPERK